MTETERQINGRPGMLYLDWPRAPYGIGFEIFVLDIRTAPGDGQEQYLVQPIIGGGCGHKWVAAASVVMDHRNKEGGKR